MNLSPFRPRLTSVCLSEHPKRQRLHGSIPRAIAGWVLFAGLSFSTVHAESPWEWIPEDSSAVVRLQAPASTVEKLSSFVDAVQPGFGSFVQTQTSSLGLAISNPTLVGVDMSRDWYAAAFIKAEGAPEILFLIPATDTDAMQIALGDDFSTVKHNGWLAYSRSPQLIDQLQGCLKGDSPSVSHLFDAQINDELNSGQLTWIVNSAILRETFAAQLDNAESQLDTAIDAIAKQASAANPDLDVTQVMQMYRDAGRAVLQGVRDSVSTVVAVHINASDLRIEKLVTFADDSTSSNFIETQPAGKLDLLTSLPEGQSGYFAVKMVPDALADWLKGLTADLIEDPDVSKRFRSAMTGMLEAGTGTFAGGASLAPSNPTALNYFGMMDVESIEKLRAAFDEFGPELEYDIAGIHQKISIEKHAETIDGTPVDILRTEQEIKPSMDPFGIQQAVNDRLYGPRGITQRLVYQEGRLLQTLGGGTDAMRQLIASSDWTDQDLLAAREQMPETANLLILADIPSFLQNVVQLIVESGKLPLPLDEDRLASLQLPSSYSGFSIATKTNRLQFRAVISAKTMQGFAQLGVFVQQSLQGGR